MRPIRFLKGPQAVFAFSVLASRIAMADVSGSDSAAAQALFDQAKQLMSAGNYGSACPKLEESQRLDPGIGTLFKLADCYEHQGRTATAWSKFLETALAAKLAGQPQREQAARERAAALSPQLSKIVIDLNSVRGLAGLQVQRDGALVGEAQWGVPIPADQGLHRVVVKAAGRRPWEKSVLVKGGGDTLLIAVPELEALVESPAGDSPGGSEPQQDVPRSPSSSNEGTSNGLGFQRTAGLAAGGIGVVALTLGTAFGLAAKSKHDTAEGLCSGSACFSQDGLDASDAAFRNGTISTVAFTVGILAAAGGAALWFTAPTKSHQMACTGVSLRPGAVHVEMTW